MRENRVLTETRRGLQLAMRAADHRPLTTDHLCLLVAVSGGADSICLCEAVARLAGELGIVPTVAHFNHQLRGRDSDDDAMFVQVFAQARGLPVHIGQGDVSRYAQYERVSIEVAARHMRYDFLAQTAQTCGAQHIVLAHHADDQAETVLLRLIRGTGIAGLQGMRPLSPLPIPTPHTPNLRLLRPLLNVSRAEIEAFCSQYGLAYRNDASNNDPHHLRNRVRLELMPLLTQFNPGIGTVLTHLAETAAEDSAIVTQATQAAFEQLVLRGSAPTIPLRLNRHAWVNLPIGLQRATLREGVRRLKGHLTHLKFAGIEEARDVLNSDASTGAIAIMGDVRVWLTRDWFEFRLGAPHPNAAQ